MGQGVSFILVARIKSIVVANNYNFGAGDKTLKARSISKLGQLDFELIFNHVSISKLL